MARMTGGEAMVGELVRHGVDTLFGMPGAQIYGLFDALQRDGSIRVITPRHEQAAAYMAFGYARATGRPGVYSVVPGPGVLNTAGAMLTAWGGNEPVLCLTGQVPSVFLGRGRGHLHEMRDQLATLQTLAKFAARAETASAAPHTIARAFQEMRSLRPGPASVEMPWEQFLAVTETDLADPLPLLPDPVPTDAIGPAAKLIAAAKQPMIFLGSGAIEAQDEVLRLAELIDAPAVAFRSGRGIVSNRHPLGLTIAEAKPLWEAVDLVIGIGTRLEAAHWRWAARPNVATIRIDIDAAEMRRTPGVTELLGRAGPTLRALLQELGPASRDKPAWREAMAKSRAAIAAALMALTPHHGHLKAIRDVLPDEGIFVDEICQAGFASWLTYPVYEKRTFITSGFQGTLGSGYLTALGVKVARPDRPVVSISGDGGFMFGVQDLATAAQYGIGVVAVIFNNGAFGNVRRDQKERFGSRFIGSELRNPDFLKLADAFGIGSARAIDAGQLRAALEKALAAGGPWLIEVPVAPDSEASPWSFLQGR